MAKRPVARDFFSDRDGSADLVCPEPTLAVQASKDECDLNVIIDKYLRTGELPAQRQGVYADLASMPDLAEAMEIADAGQEAFMELPANIRREFDNDPRKLVAFAADPRNTERAIELGLATRRVTPPSQPDPVPAPAPEKGASKPS